MEYEKACKLAKENANYFDRPYVVFSWGGMWRTERMSDPQIQGSVIFYPEHKDMTSGKTNERQHTNGGVCGDRGA